MARPASHCALGHDDPAKVEGSDDARRKAFIRAFSELSTRINLLLSLSLTKLDRLALQKRLVEIGKLGQETTA
jgi:arsenate reductase